jgi:hypothetical protein
MSNNKLNLAITKRIHLIIKKFLIIKFLKPIKIINILK